MRREQNMLKRRKYGDEDEGEATRETIKRKSQGSEPMRAKREAARLKGMDAVRKAYYPDVSWSPQQKALWKKLQAQKKPGPPPGEIGL